MSSKLIGARHGQPATRRVYGQSASELEPEDGLEPTTCALRGWSTQCHLVPLSPVLSLSVLVRGPECRLPGTSLD